MAYTKIHAIKATINKAVDYICNPSKTDEKILIDSFGTSPETASFDFKAALSKTSASDPNLAFHLIQSFAPGEVSYDEAHKIGIELADRLLEGKFSYIVSTHIDKNHIHNHVIFCAADNIHHHKYHDCKSSYYRIRNLSDELCTEHNLSIIAPSNKRGMKYNEWALKNNGTSYKQLLKQDIDTCINAAKNYDHFIELMRLKGYEIKGDSLSTDAAKYISFKPSGSKQFIRGSAKSLGDKYTKESINNRIIKRQENTHKIPFPKKNITTKTKDLTRDVSIKNVIDTTSDRYTQSPGLKRWASIQNLKLAAKAYATANSISELQQQLSEKKENAKMLRSSIVSLEKDMKSSGEILKYARQYKTNKQFAVKLHRAKDPDTYYRTHDTQILLFNGAENFLRMHGINPATINISELESRFSAMENQKNKFTSLYQKIELEIKDLETKLQNLREFLGSLPDEIICEVLENDSLQNELLTPNQNRNTNKSL